MMPPRRLMTTGLVTLGALAAGALASGAPAIAAAPEAPVTEAATGITGSTATLNGELNPGASATAGYFFTYNTNGTCTEAFVTEPGAEAAGQGLKVATELVGLLPSTEYTFCLVATHAEGEVTETTSGSPLSFKTLDVAPTVDGESASGLTSTDATLEAQVNPNIQETTYAFEYATDEALTGATTVPGANPLTAEFGDQLASVDIGGGLQPATTYYYRVVATNAAGPTQGVVQSFTTLAAPVLTTAQAQSVGRSGVTLSGTVNPGGAQTVYHFGYVDQAGYEAALAKAAQNPYATGGRTADLTLGPDHAVHPVAFQVDELKPGTTYHYAVIATNSVDTVIGPDAAFTTAPATPPVVVTGTAVGVTQLSATLAAAVDGRGLPTTSAFEFGPTPALGSSVPATRESDSGTTVQIAASLGNYLQAGTTYYYRVVATNADGTSYGAVRSFATGAFPAAFTLSSTPALLPYTSIADLDAREAREGKPTSAPAPLTTRQKLARALRACGRKAKPRRAACRRQARDRYRHAPKRHKT